ncbi:hypothetical protein JW756_01230 [Candidatus Woesearchaeota archaeon]|nr:hypothetical protein [Candidatus Woesearchaeota archaeon]
MKKTRKETRKEIIVQSALALIIFLLHFAIAAGIGASPATKTLLYEPNQVIELDLNILNPEQNDMQVSISSTGEIQDMIFIQEPVINVKAADYKTPFKVIVQLPSELSPGTHSGHVKMTPLLENNDQSGVIAFVAPQIRITIRVPYPAKYADVSLLITEVDEGTPLPMAVLFDNLGSEDIQRAGASIELYNPAGELLDKTSTNEISIAKNTLGNARAQSSPILRKGAYRAVANAYYDGFEKSTESNFTIGIPVIKVKELFPKKLVRGEINKLDFKVSSDWNTELPASGLISIKNIESEFPLFTINPGEEKTINSFFDTTGLGIGEYTLTVKLAYADQVRSYNFPVSIVEKTAFPEIAPTSTALILIIVSLLLLICGVIIAIILRKRRLSRERNL